MEEPFELGFTESWTEDTFVAGSGLGHEVDERVEVGVWLVGLLGGAIRRIGLIVASTAGNWRGGSAASSNLGVKLRSLTNLSFLCSTIGTELPPGNPGGGFGTAFEFEKYDD